MSSPDSLNTVSPRYPDTSWYSWIHSHFTYPQSLIVDWCECQECSQNLRLWWCDALSWLNIKYTLGGADWRLTVFWMCVISNEWPKNCTKMQRKKIHTFLCPMLIPVKQRNEFYCLRSLIWIVMTDWRWMEALDNAWVQHWINVLILTLWSISKHILEWIKLFCIEESPLNLYFNYF